MQDVAKMVTGGFPIAVGQPVRVKVAPSKASRR